jgi:hypothetical protein
MSGPYPPPGYPRPPEDGWWGGQQQGGPQSGPPSGPFGVPPESPQYDFPTVQYSGLAGQPGGWGEPPRRRNTGRMIVAVVSVLVIIGGVVTGAILLNNRHDQQQAAAPPPAVPAPATTLGQQTGVEEPTTTPDDPGEPNGSTTLTLDSGTCVTAEVVANEQYKATHKAICGTGDSDLVLATTTPDMTGCANHQYLRLTAPSTGVDCFTLDIKPGDCVDANYLKVSCGTAQFTVLTTENGPGGDDSCTAATGATHWVPVGRDPVRVGCLGPPKKS